AMRQGAEQSAPTSFPCTITCMIMLIIVNRIQFSYYSSYSIIMFRFNIKIRSWYLRPLVYEQDKKEKGSAKNGLFSILLRENVLGF
ncbi:hypothetical protein, partial [uncultured Bacteroides sp.]|uniref:hypothetical protein n=1 Tax=uncultured Bacteroides sp. TaxID=162156 RepID=UPI00261CF2F9